MCSRRHAARVAAPASDALQRVATPRRNARPVATPRRTGASPRRGMARPVATRARAASAALQRGAARRGERADAAGRYSQHKFRAHYNRGNCYRKLHRLHESVADLEAAVVRRNATRRNARRRNAARRGAVQWSVERKVYGGRVGRLRVISRLVPFVRSDSGSSAPLDYPYRLFGLSIPFVCSDYPYRISRPAIRRLSRRTPRGTTTSASRTSSCSSTQRPSSTSRPVRARSQSRASAACAADSHNAVYINNKGLAHYRVGEYEAALRDFDTAIRRAPARAGRRCDAGDPGHILHNRL